MLVFGLKRAGAMRFVQAVKGFFEGFREGVTAQREIEGRANEPFRWIALFVILALFLSAFLWVVISIIR
jgi:hypothetical protein